MEALIILIATWLSVLFLEAACWTTRLLLRWAPSLAAASFIGIDATHRGADGRSALLLAIGTALALRLLISKCRRLVARDRRL